MTPLEDKIKWDKDIARTNDPIDFYKAHYSGLDRGQLRREDRKLYYRLWRDRLLEYVPTSRKFGENHLAYYQRHYADLSRGQLRRKNPSLYQMLWREGLLKKVPQKSTKRQR